MNGYFIYLMRKNQVVHLALHLVAGLVAVTLLSGAAGKTKAATPSAPLVAAAGPGSH